MLITITRRYIKWRLAAIQSSGHPASAQATIKDSNYYFVDRGDALVERVAEWLSTL